MHYQHLPQVSNTLNLFSAIKQHNWGSLRHFVSSLSRCSVLALTFSVAAVGCTTHQNTTTYPNSANTPITIIRVSGSGTGLPIVKTLAQAYSQTHPQIQFEFESGTNTGGAIQGVLKQTLDIAVANRGLSASEAQQALAYHPFAKDAIAFVVQRTNRVKHLTSAQVRDIYRKKVRNWQQLGGKNAPIIVLDRDPDESARKLILVPFMQGYPVAAQTTVLYRAKEMVDALESTPDAIGYTSVGLLTTMQTKQLQTLTLDKTSPNAATVAQGQYPWYLTLALIHRRDASTSIQNFVEFVLRQEGRQLLEKHGYAAIRP